RERMVKPRCRRQPPAAGPRAPSPDAGSLGTRRPGAGWQPPIFEHAITTSTRQRAKPNPGGYNRMLNVFVAPIAFAGCTETLTWTTFAAEAPPFMATRSRWTPARTTRLKRFSPCPVTVTRPRSEVRTRRSRRLPWTVCDSTVKCAGFPHGFDIVTFWLFVLPDCAPKL